MKYKKKVAYLQARQQWWDRMGGSYQKAHKRPGSVKVR
jgi:hypothetical protein